MNDFTTSWDDREFPLAYLITIRTYGTWLHGDKRRSVDTHHGRNRYGVPKLEQSKKLEKRMIDNAKYSPITFSLSQRVTVDAAVREPCRINNFDLLALNVRTNHLHAVISAASKPEQIISRIKRFSTRKLREDQPSLKGFRIWSRGGSRRYLWKPRYVDLVVDYVLYGQGKLDFEEPW